MTSIVVHELVTTLEQEFTVNVDSRIKLYGVRPYLYVHAVPSGTFTLSVIYDSNVVDSNTFTAQQIKDSLGTTNNYIRSFFRIYMPKVPSLKDDTYSLRLSSSGYTFSESSYIGWIAEHEDLTNNISYTPDGDQENPLSFQLWGHKWYAY